MNRNLNYQELDGQVYATNLDLTGKLDLFGAKHDVLAGFDFFYDYYEEHSGRIFVTYDFKNLDMLNGWRLGFGVTAVGDRPGNIQNNFVLPGYVRLDAFAGYRLRVGPSRVTAQLNFENLADEDYFEGTDIFFQSGPRLGILPGAPLTVIGTIGVEF